MNPAFRTPLLGLACLSLASSANAATLFFDDFESPNVSAAQSDGNTSGAIDTSKWVRNDQGFGATRQGTVDEAHGDFADPGGEQAYAFRYTNSGITTTAGSIGSLALGTTYTVTFDAVADGHNTPDAGTPYTAGLFTFDGGARNAMNSGGISQNTTATLATVSGNATSDGLYTPVSFTFTANAKTDYAVLLQDLSLRFQGATTSAIIDNVQVSAEFAAPTLFWDTNSGTWDGTTANWNTKADGTGTSQGWNAQQAFFATTGDYTVTMDGSQDIGLVVFQDGGTVTLANGASGALNLTANTPIEVASGMTVNAAVPITEDAAGRELIKVGAGTLSLSGDISSTGLTTVTQGKLVLSGNNVAATGGMDLVGGVTQFESAASINGTARDVTVNAGSTVVFGSSFGAGNIQNALSDRIVASSTGVIATDNYAGTNFDFGTAGLTAAYLGAVGNVNYTGTLTPGGTTYRLGGGGGTLTMTNTNAITGANSLIVQGDVVFNASNNFTGGATVNSGATLNLGASQNFGGGLTVSSGATLITGPTQAYSGGLTLNGGTVVVSAGTYSGFGTGDLTINNGSTIIGVNGSSFTSTNNSFMNGTITLDRNVTGVTTWNHGGDITLNGNVVLNSSKNGWTTVVDGSIGQSGNRSLTVSGNTNSLTLNNANTFTGGLTYNSGGTLGINDAAALGTGTFTIQAGKIDNTSGAAITLSTNNVQSWNGNFTFTGTDDLNLGTGAVTMNNNRTLTVAANTLTVGGGIAESGGSRSLTKSGSGTLQLDGANTYTGATNVNGGTLLINGSTSSTSIVSVASGATLGGSGTVGGNTTISGTLSPGTSPGTLNFASDLTLNNNAIYALEAGDLTAVGLTLTLNDNWTLALGSGFQDGGQVLVFTYGILAGGADLDPTFNTDNLGFTPTGTLSLTDDGSGSIFLNGVSIIPEPRAALLGSLGMLLLLRRRR